MKSDIQNHGVGLRRLTHDAPGECTDHRTAPGELAIQNHEGTAGRNGSTTSSRGGEEIFKILHHPRPLLPGRVPRRAGTSRSGR